MAGKEPMKNAGKLSRFAAATMMAALLLTSGVLAAGGVVTAMNRHLSDEEASTAEKAAVEERAASTGETALPEETAAPESVPATEITEEAAASHETALEPPAAGEAPSQEGVSQETTSEETAPEETAPYIQPAAQVEEDWRLLLVNPWNALPEGYEMDLVTLSNGLKVDQRIYEDLEAMLSACREEGLNPIVCSAYRTQATQERLYNNKIARLRAAGWTGEALLAEAARWVAPPGTSEHQTGLALDIVSAGYQVLDEKQEDTAEQQWLMEHSWEYGFILRYPEDQTEITGIGYEPWHYRYVGRETAAAIEASGLCLEEYLQTLPASMTEASNGETAQAETGEEAETVLTAQTVPADVATAAEGAEEGLDQPALETEEALPENAHETDPAPETDSAAEADAVQEELP